MTTCIRPGIGLVASSMETLLNTSSFLMRGPIGEMAAMATIGGIAGASLIELVGNPHDAAIVGLATCMAAWLALATLMPWRQPVVTAASRAIVAADLLAAEPARRAHRRQAAKRDSAVASLAALAVIGLLLELTPAGSTLATWLEQTLGGFWTAQILFAVAAITVACRVLSLPVHIRRHLIARRHNASRSWMGLLREQVKAALLGGALLAVPLVGLAALARLAPHWWWVWAALIAGAMWLILRFGLPQLVLLGAKPLPAGPLRQRLLALIAQAGIAVRDIVVVNARTGDARANAGLITAHRHTIMLYKSALPASTDDQSSITEPATNTDPQTTGKQAATPSAPTIGQLAAVVAHELGHGVPGEVFVTTAMKLVQLTAVMCGLYLLNSSTWLLELIHAPSITDPHAIGLYPLLTVAVGVPFTVLNNLIGRRYGAHADLFALDLTGDATSFSDVVRANAGTGTLDVDPDPVSRALWWNHPSTVERIAAIHAWERHQKAAQKTSLAHPAEPGQQPTPAGHDR
jgi:STE24 endopeptidase